MLWYPYTQMKNMKEPITIESADGVFLNTKEYGPLIDTISSWWSVMHGYNVPELNKAITDQVTKYAHVIAAGTKQQPSQKCAKAIADILPGDLQHVFFSDSGSVAVEVALKMALQFYSNQNIESKDHILSLTHSYHGDTFMTMGIGDDPDYHGKFSKYNKLFQINPSIDELEKCIKENHSKIAAFIVEPLLQGAGGLKTHSIEFLKRARELCSEYGIILIFDEVATGFGRLGVNFVSDLVQPDIVVLGKALTGGYIGHAATVTNKLVYDAFYDDDHSKALMHGPTFMGNALACSVALASIELFIKNNLTSKAKEIEKIFKQELKDFAHEKIKEIRIIGACFVIELKDAKDKKGFQEHCFNNGLFNRPFINYLYSMPPLVSSKDDILKIVKTFKSFFK